jgi:hypothetical protein
MSEAMRVAEKPPYIISLLPRLAGTTKHSLARCESQHDPRNIKDVTKKARLLLVET